MAFESRRSIRFAAMEGALGRWVTFHFDTFLAVFIAFANSYWLYKCYKLESIVVARFESSMRLDYKLDKRQTNFLEFSDGLAAHIRFR